jgi:hypothetical protein
MGTCTYAGTRALEEDTCVSYEEEDTCIARVLAAELCPGFSFIERDLLVFMSHVYATCYVAVAWY